MYIIQNKHYRVVRRQCRMGLAETRTYGKTILFYHSNFSSSSNRERTTSLLVSSISPARKTSSKMAYTCRGIVVTWGRFKACDTSTNLVKVEDEIEFTYVVEERILAQFSKSAEVQYGEDSPSTSTNRCIASRYASSLSFASTHTQKKSPAYRRYTILWLRNCRKHRSIRTAHSKGMCGRAHLDEV